MKKGPLVLSILLTGVVLALLFTLVSVYKPAEATETQSPYAFQFDAPADALSTPSLANTPIPGTVSIYDAAAEAAKVLGRDDVYLTEYSQLNGADAYLVTFLSGDLVYVSMDGQVISTSKRDPVNPYQPTSHK
jgi:hypothetical protein